MKANELQIGDWVKIVEPCKYAGAIGCVKTLIDHKDNENAYFKVFLRNNTIHIGIEDICSDDVKPIPLTPEILEKNGWKRLTSPEGEDVLVLDLGTTVLWWFVKDKELVLIGGSHLKIEYVHQLQHALRLCGIEKTIEL